MATVIPSGFTLSDITDKSEQSVVRLLERRLSDDWIVVPNYQMTSREREHEMDTIVMHRRYGVAIIEVKGGRITLVKGEWQHNGDRVKPDVQARTNAHALNDRIASVIDRPHFKVLYGIALPEVRSFDGDLPASLQRGQILLAPDLDEIDRAIEDLFNTHATLFPLTDQEFQNIVNLLCPSADFVFDPFATQARARLQLEAMCEAQVASLRSLDRHHRVFVTGRAGTGKTYLATEWAKAGLLFDEDEGEQPLRVLLLCYNDPLGHKLRSQLADFCGDNPTLREFLTVGPVLRTLLELPGMPVPDFPAEESNHYWSTLVPGHIISQWSHVTARFDRIIVDEAQDFSPAWLGLLESLLDETGANQMFLLADDRQQLQDRGFVAPTPAAGWVCAELKANVRNPRQIASLARRCLDGAAASSELPASDEIVVHRYRTEDELIELVDRELIQAAENRMDARDILVIAAEAKLRDQLREMLDLYRYEEHEKGHVPCEAPHRSKGLEAPLVILVGGAHPIDDERLYVAITRCTSKLVIIDAGYIIDRLKLVS